MLNRESAFMTPFRAVSLGVRIFIKYWPLFAIAAAVFYLPLNAATALIPQSLARDVAALYGAFYGEGGAASLENVWNLPNSVLFGVLGYLGLVQLFSNIFATTAAGAAAFLTIRELRDEGAGEREAVVKPSVAELLEASAARAPKYFVTATIVTIIQFLGGALLFVPTIFITVAVPFAECVTADTGKWGLAAIRENLRLTRSKWWATAWFILVMRLASVAITSFFSSTGTAVGDVAISTLSEFICLPISAATCVLYFQRAYPKADSREDN